MDKNHIIAVDGVLVHLNAVKSVFLLVLNAYLLIRKFARLADRNKACSQSVCQCGTYNESSGFYTTDLGYTLVLYIS